MSIWCSWRSIGYDHHDEAVGTVLTYAAGFSNHHPDLTGTHELPAEVGIAHIAPWCVPGHNQDGPAYACTGCGGRHDGEVGPWLRLSVSARAGMSFWGDPNPPTREPVNADAVLDRAAVTALRDDLTKWLAADHVEPIETEEQA